jgi:maleate isomerase
MSVPQKRVGVIVPSLNTIVEDDFRQFLPREVGYHVARVRLRKTNGVVTHEALLEAAEEAPHSAGFLADALVDAIAFNCTGACVEGGQGSNERIVARIAAATRIPTTTTILALLEALRALHVRRLVHVCPFTASFGNDEARFLREAGFEVVATTAMNHVDARLVARLDPQAFVEAALAHDRPDADAVFLACANARTFEAIEAAEARLRKPVITSNQVVIWELLRMVGIAPHSVHGGGMLFDRVEVAA